MSTYYFCELFKKKKRENKKEMQTLNNTAF